MTIAEHYSLLKHNTFHIEANSRYFIEYDSEDELIATLSSNIVRTNDVLPIGSGSNLLFTRDFDGVILHSGIKGFTITEKKDAYTSVQIGAGEIWDNVVDYCIKSNLYGAENLSLIPGEIGAAAVQNIGAYAVEIKDIIETVDAVEIKTGRKRRFSKDECNYAYRESIFKKELKNQYIITFVTLRLSNAPHFQLDYGNIKEALSAKGELTLQTVRDTIIEIRESKLPNPEKIGNAGSFFMNPYISRNQFADLKQTHPTIPSYPVSETEVKIPAAWLIEQCGWEGKTIGNVGVHDKQSLVLVNKGHAKAQEIVDLSQLIIKSVEEKFHICLIPEVIFL